MTSPINYVIGQTTVTCSYLFVRESPPVHLTSLIVPTNCTGEQGEDFFLIESGTVLCTQAKSATDATEMALLNLGAGDYFGEMALMLDEPRAANCIAGGGQVVILGKNEIEDENAVAEGCSYTDQ